MSPLNGPMDALPPTDLYIGFEDTYQLLSGKMSDEQAEAFYASSSTLGSTLQVTEDMWPATRA
ncbi:oxygenase MpaB family protein, partial [Nocardia farcinica]|uniref:oxygenase MpaB family protein n=1 Tax=Nocardia farcinica TaxID=37329 RepID=UPI00245536D3